MDIFKLIFDNIYQKIENTLYHKKNDGDTLMKLLNLMTIKYI